MKRLEKLAFDNNACFLYREAMSWCSAASSVIKRLKVFPSEVAASCLGGYALREPFTFAS